MAIVKCPNGHTYDDAIYGDNCPYCPTKVNHVHDPNPVQEESTRVMNSGPSPIMTPPQDANIEMEKPTEVIPNNLGNVNGAPEYVKEHTQIHHIKDQQVKRAPNPDPNETVAIPENGRRIVGVLASYNNNPNGNVFYIYEGRTIVGKDPSSCDAVIKGDSGVSGRHLIILYREVEDKFWLIDDNTSNGTFLNGAFAGDKTQIHTNDVITIGSTKLVFWAIPKIWD